MDAKSVIKAAFAILIELSIWVVLVESVRGLLGVTGAPEPAGDEVLETRTPCFVVFLGVDGGALGRRQLGGIVEGLPEMLHVAGDDLHLIGIRGHGGETAEGESKPGNDESLNCMWSMTP